MQIQRAASLGLLHQQLGIASNARVSFQITDTGVTVWDLETETRYTVGKGMGNATAIPFTLDQQVKNIIGCTDDELKERFAKTSADGWRGERETIFTELTFRGISVLGGCRLTSPPPI